MIYVAAGLAAIALIVGLLVLVGRGAERRERAHRHRRGITAGGGVEGGVDPGGDANTGDCGGGSD
jgi:hypothetical protein